MTRLAPTLCLLIAPLLAACADGVAEVQAVDPAPPASGRYGLVVLTAQLGEPGIALSGQLMDYQGVSQADALRALTAPELVWLADDHLAAGTCQLLDTEPHSPEGHTQVDLLDAGPILVRAPAPLEEGQLVPPRELPALVNALAGVVYDADTDLPYLSGGLYRVQADGAELGALSGEVEAPGPVWLDSHQLDDAGLDLHLGGGPDAYVVLTRAAAGRAVACLPLEGADALRVPPEALRHLGPGTIEIDLLRVRRAPLVAEGLPGALLFVTRDATWLTLPDLPSEERAR